MHAGNPGTATIHVLRNAPVARELVNLFNQQKLSSRFWGQNTISICAKSGEIITSCRGVAFKRLPTIDSTYTSFELDVGIIDP
jgi:hypothetical protein